MAGACRIPANYLRGTHGNDEASSDEHESRGGKTPLLVFINSGSGGHVGEQLAEYFKQALGKGQVYTHPSMTPNSHLFYAVICEARSLNPTRTDTASGDVSRSWSSSFYRFSLTSLEVMKEEDMRGGTRSLPQERQSSLQVVESFCSKILYSHQVDLICSEELHQRHHKLPSGV